MPAIHSVGDGVIPYLRQQVWGEDTVDRLGSVGYDGVRVFCARPSLSHLTCPRHLSLYRNTYIGSAPSSSMVEVTIEVLALGETRVIEGELVQEHPPIIEEPHDNRPSWRVEPDGSVTLLSANTDHEIEGFGRTEYCFEHSVDVASIAYNHCPKCRMRDRQEAMEIERSMRHAPRSYDDCADIGAYRH
jgi:hypothetical protein